MKRRDFLKSVGYLALTESVISLPGAAQAEELWLTRKSRVLGLSILQGMTTETTTQLTVDIEKTITAAYQLVDLQTNRIILPCSLRPVTNQKSSIRVDKVGFSELELGHRYRLVVTDTKNNSVLDERFLSTLDLNKENARVALMSCMQDGKSARTKMWASAEAANLDLLLFIGDAVYGDSLFSHGPDFLWGRFVTSRQNIPFYRWKNLKPVVAVWDDHDFGKNNEGGTYKYKTQALEIFKTFFAQDPVGDALFSGPGNSSVLTAFNQNFILFDCRYFRGLQNEMGNSGFLGIEQIDWATDLTSMNDFPSVVIQGSPYFGRTQKDSAYHGKAPQELDYLLGKISSGNGPAIFAGGDLHYSELSEFTNSTLGYKSYELISSSMHSNIKGRFYDNPNPRLQGYLKENFLVLEKRGNAQDGDWTVTCLAADSKLIFTEDCAV